MITKDERRAALPNTLVWGGLGLAIFVVGILVGIDMAGAPVRLQIASPGANESPFVSRTKPIPATLGLNVLSIRMGPAAVQTLEGLRGEAMRTGILEQTESSMVAATAALDSYSSLVGTSSAVAVQVRLKGDFTDHMDTDKWSLRIEPDGDATLAGMSKLSIQHPKTRGFYTEWLVMQMGRKLGLITPRCQFVRVRINDVDSGVYYLEEHFSKEMLEAAGRRDGPIVRFNEASFWSVFKQFWSSDGQVDPASAGYTTALSPVGAEISVYGEKKFARDGRLRARRDRAIAALRALRVRTIDPERVPLLAMQEASDQRESELEQLFDADALGRWLALSALVNGHHGVTWHQLRFFHDPVRDRLEPLVFDTGAVVLTDAAGFLLFEDWVEPLLDIAGVRDAAYRTLWTMLDPAWRAELFAEIHPELSVGLSGLVQEGLMAEALANPDIVQRALTLRSETVAKIIAPLDAANFAATLRTVGVGRAADPQGFSKEFEDVSVTLTEDRELVVEAWAVTEVPTLVEEFRFDDGHTVSAQAVWQPRSGDASAAQGNIAVLLGRQGSRTRFVLTEDSRMSGLQTVKDVVRRIEQGEAGTAAAVRQAAGIRVATRTLGAPGEAVEIALSPRRGSSSDADEGRPEPPTLKAALSQCPLLRYEPGIARLSIEPGTHALNADLFLPRELPLHIPAGTTLTLAPGIIVYAAGGLIVEGTASSPVVFASENPSQPAAGILVLDAPVTSRLEHTTFRDLGELNRGSWQSLGGVTFYFSPLVLTDCRFEDGRGEDVLNVVGSEVALTRCVFDGGASDLFDGDFVTGSVTDCSFANSVEDGLDVSGSRLTVTGCTFTNMGDKGISAGERSMLVVSASRVVSAAIGVASKDASTVTLRDLVVEQSDHWALAAFIKKSEYGTSRIDATNLRVLATGRGDALVQTGCVILRDGTELPTEEIDVPELYRQKVLGK